MVVDYKHKIGFKGTILIEPKPQEPTKHQYDYDVATVFGFLQRFGLEKEVKVNIEVGHAFLAGHSFEHEIATAAALGIFGSVDANRNDCSPAGTPTSSRTTSRETALALYYILQGRRPHQRRLQLRRQAPPPVARSRGPDRRAMSAAWTCCARGLLAAAAMIEDGGLAAALEERYAGWETPGGAGDADERPRDHRRRASTATASTRSRARAGRSGWRTGSTASSEAADPRSPAPAGRGAAPSDAGTFAVQRVRPDVADRHATR